jgi:hypothetical protein
MIKWVISSTDNEQKHGVLQESTDPGGGGGLKGRRFPSSDAAGQQLGWRGGNKDVGGGGLEGVVPTT